MSKALWVRFSVPFRRPEDADRFVGRLPEGRLADAQQLPERRQRFWVQLTECVAGGDALGLRTIAAMSERVRALAELPESEHLRTTVWPTHDIDRPLSTQVAALFGSQGGAPGLRIGFYPTGAGWARGVVTDGTTTIDISASYLEDALGDLAELGCALLRPRSPSPTCVFQEEPGEYRFIAVAEEGTSQQRPLLLELRWFRDTYSREPDSAGELILSVPSTPLELARAIRSTVDDVVHRYGEPAYEALWQHPFPRARRDELDRLLRG